MTDPSRASLKERAVVELIATAFLLIAIVGSGIAADRLCGGNVGLALLVNALATSAALFVIILIFAPVSGAHLNPAVTLSAAMLGEFDWRAVPIYVAAQIAGAVVGTWIAHGMFDLALLQVGTHIRTGPGQWLAEMVATVGLLAVVWGCVARSTSTAAAAVALYIGGAYWFTASTSFANPAVTLARALTDTFSGIRPVDVIGFIAAQLGALLIMQPVLRRWRRISAV